MATARKTITISTDALLDAADRVAKLDQGSLQKVLVDGLNEVTERAYDIGRDRITSDVNLDDDYLRRRMDVEYADRRLRTEIVAYGSSQNMTRLATYNAHPVIVPRETAYRNRNRGKNNIPQGMKQAGVTVEVRRGNEKEMGRAFMMRLRAGAESGEKFGVFIREGQQVKHLFAPAVYQLFRVQSARIAPEVADDLETTVLDRLEKHIEANL